MPYSQTKDFQHAINPNKNIAVFASAGTGKTQLLVHRILKLLLNDADPAQILAITFTRKSAAEMRERLMTILKKWAELDDIKLKESLKHISHTYDYASITKAKNLYETLLFADYDIRITTFHAFCQDILKKFALHAGIPAGFNVAENTEDLKREALIQIYKIAHSRLDPKLSNTLFTLLNHCGTVFNVNTALDSFINAKSDWWSFTENQDDPADFAASRMHQYFLSNQNEPDANQIKQHLIALLKQYCHLLKRIGPETTQNCNYINGFLTDENYLQIEDIPEVISIFLTKKQTVRVLKSNKILEKSLDAIEMQSFIRLHEDIGNLLIQQMDLLKVTELISFNEAWFYAGYKLLNEFQKIKFNNHLLDFDDLEWHTYMLLKKHKDSSWIQYKLDQQIKHILIDEFQDTNPTQWNLLFPLLEEIASHPQQANKSLFFVGDTKQSIYSFRRANPQLQFTASKWAKKYLNAKLINTERSFRSSPVIIDFVNKVFGVDRKYPLIKTFIRHEAVQTDLWGQVHIDPLIIQEKISATPESFPNPLLQANTNANIDANYVEGKSVSEKIKNLVSASTAIFENGKTRAVQYGDILVLARNRAHLEKYESALREFNIPYISVNEGEFLDQLEVQDILALLTYLIQPFNDLAIAQVLRSPCFGISNEELMKISLYQADSLIDKIKVFSDSSPTSIASQAIEQLNIWQYLANKIPVHDLLDKVFFDINIFERYKRSCGPAKQQQVCSNLTQLLHLSLDIDAGRYSSIQSFLNTVQNSHFNNNNSNSQNIENQSQNAVRILTIHAAKGLEAPIVFLIDAATSLPNKKAYQPIINWPPNANQPTQFFIIGRKGNLDSNTQLTLKDQNNRAWEEELNLFYVALTRAKQYLFISGVQGKKGVKQNWYSIINKALENEAQDTTSNSIIYSYGNPPDIKSTNPSIKHEYVGPPFDLSKPFPHYAQHYTLLDSQNETASEKASHGTLVHKIFELMIMNGLQISQSLKAQAEIALGERLEVKEFSHAMAEIKACVENPDIHELFEQKPGKIILNEIPVSSFKDNQLQYHIIDFLIITKELIWIIDFKTTSNITIETMDEKAKLYRYQISNYVSTVKLLYPKNNIRASILFTSIATIYYYDAHALIQ